MRGYIDVAELTDDELETVYGISFSCAVTANSHRNADEAVYYYGLGRLIYSLLQEREQDIFITKLLNARARELENIYRNKN